MLQIFLIRRLNKRIFKEFIDGVENRTIGIKQCRELLPTLPIDVVVKLGEKIIWSDYDGYNKSRKESEVYYFYDLDRWQKEFFIEQRFYKLLGIK